MESAPIEYFLVTGDLSALVRCLPNALGPDLRTRAFAEVPRTMLAAAQIIRHWKQEVIDS